jgi:ribA/ribD-fused uncharacterized protein
MSETSAKTTNTKQVKSPTKGPRKINIRPSERKDDKGKVEEVTKKRVVDEEIVSVADSIPDTVSECTTDSTSVYDENPTDEISKKSEDTETVNNTEQLLPTKEDSSIKEELPIKKELPIKNDIITQSVSNKETNVDKQVGEVVKKPFKVTPAIKFIYFNSRSRGSSFMSNFYPSKLMIDGKEYWHVEGYYQSQKFAGFNEVAEEHIRKALSPGVCKRLAYDYPLPEHKKKEWNDGLKDKIMRRAVLCKFITNGDLARQLIATGDAMLVEDNVNDDYWACGVGNKGQNKLGNILMSVREFIAQL